jgi:hypothetical protein
MELIEHHEEDEEYIPPPFTTLTERCMEQVRIMNLGWPMERLVRALVALRNATLADTRLNDE